MTRETLDGRATLRSFVSILGTGLVTWFPVVVCLAASLGPKILLYALVPAVVAMALRWAYLAGGGRLLVYKE